MSAFDFEGFERDVDKLITAKGVRGVADWVDEPMDLDAWLTDAAIFGRMQLSDLQYDALRHAERVLLPETFEELGWPEVRTVSELNLAVGKGGGKGLTSRLIIARAVYLMLMLRDPLGYWGFPSTDTIHFMNVALNAPQAGHVIFTPMLEMFKASRFYSERMEPRQRWIEFEKGLMAESGHSGQDSQEGRSVLVGIIDEISGFKSAHELEAKRRLNDREPTQSGEGIHRMLRSSIRSRFGDAGKLVSISYPRFKGCMIDSLVRDTELELEELGEASRRYAVRASSWAFNPLIEGKHVFEDDYRRDPQGARTMYEAKPSASPHRYFQNLLPVRRAMGAPISGEMDKEPAVLRVGTEFYWGLDPMNPEQSVDGWQVRFDLESLEKHRHPLALHADLALRHDAAGLAAAHVSEWVTESETLFDEMGREVTREVRKPRYEVDFVIGFESIQPDPLRGLEGSDIQMRWVRQLVRELINRGWVIGSFTADGFQSADLLQTFESWGIVADTFSLDRTAKGYDTLKSVIYENAVRIPWHPVLFAELEALTKLPNGKLDHPAGLSKDLADALGGAVHGAVVYAEANAPYDDEDEWVGGSVEQMARAHAEAADLLGRVPEPRSPEEFEDYMDEQFAAASAYAAFEGARPAERPRSGDQPWR